MTDLRESLLNIDNLSTDIPIVVDETKKFTDVRHDTDDSKIVEWPESLKTLRELGIDQINLAKIDTFKWMHGN